MRRLLPTAVVGLAFVLVPLTASAADQVMPEPNSYEAYEIFLSLNGARLTIPFSRGRYRFIADRDFISWPAQFPRRELATRKRHTGAVRGQYEIQPRRTRGMSRYFDFNLDVSWNPLPGVECTLRDIHLEVAEDSVSLDSGGEDECLYRVEVLVVDY